MGMPSFEIALTLIPCSVLFIIIIKCFSSFSTDEGWSHEASPNHVRLTLIHTVAYQNRDYGFGAVINLMLTTHSEVAIIFLYIEYLMWHGGMNFCFLCSVPNLEYYRALFVCFSWPTLWAFFCPGVGSFRFGIAIIGVCSTIFFLS